MAVSPLTERWSWWPQKMWSRTSLSLAALSEGLVGTTLPSPKSAQAEEGRTQAESKKSIQWLGGKSLPIGSRDPSFCLVE